MTLRRTNGAMTSSRTVTIAPRQQVAQFISELFAECARSASDFDGTLTLTSNTPVAIVALRFRGANFSTIPITSLSPQSAFPNYIRHRGPDAVSFPQFVADGGGRRKRRSKQRHRAFDRSY